MKKILIFLLVLLILPNVLAVEVEINESFNQGETMIAKVSGNFISPLTKENIFFYRGHTRTPMEYGVMGVEGEYYIYALLIGKEAGDYSLSIENAQYMRGVEITGDNIARNFSITNDTADFSVNPGVVSASGDFSLEIQNLQDSKITVNVKTKAEESRRIFIYPELSEESSIQLLSGQKKQIDFKLNSGEIAFKKIQLQTNNTSYEIPISMPTSSEGTPEPTFSLEPSTFNYSFPTSSTLKKTVYLYNTGTVAMKNISLSLSDSLTPFMNISIKEIKTLDAGSNVPLELIFYSKAETGIEGELKAKTGETIAYSSISVQFVNDYVIPKNQSGQFSIKPCAELQGVICNNESVKCNTELIKAKDGLCCKGTCSVIKKSSAGKIIAVVIILALIGGGVWFYFKKFKKAKKPVDLVQISKVKDISGNKI